MTKDQLNELLNRACEIITSLEGYAKEHSHYPDHNKELQKTIDDFFNEVDMLNADPRARKDYYQDNDPDIVELERATAYENYVASVKRSIDKATEEGILRDDDSEGYSYLSEEEFSKRLEVDPRFVEMGDPNWLFPGEPIHDEYYYDPEDKLDIVKTNISDLVTWLDKNNKMSAIPDEIWRYIINIEKVVGISNEYTDPDAEAQDYDTFGKNKI